MKTSSPHVLITGGAGFIGSHLAERLLADGRPVTIIDDCSTGSIDNLRNIIKHPCLRFIQSRVSECPNLSELAAQSGAIYHLAAAVGVELVLNSGIRSIENNLHETKVILDAASERQVPILLASTSEVYGKSQKPAFSETDDLLIGPSHLSRWSYACSKLMDEFLGMAHAKEKGTPVVIARLFNTVGPRQTGRYGMVLPRFIRAALKGEPLQVFGDGRQTRCFCYVADTVESLIRLQSCNSARGEVFNVGTTDEVSIGYLAQVVIELLQSRSRIEYIPYTKAYPAGFEDMLRRKPVVDKLESHVKYRPSTTLHEIIRLTAASMA